MLYNWQSILAANETVQTEFGISPRYRLITTVAIVIVGFIVGINSLYPGLFIFILAYLYSWYLKTAKHFAFTNSRVILVDSFLGKSITSIDYNQITDIEVEQNALDQMGGWGTLVVNTAGTHAPETRLSFIDNPVAMQQTLDKVRNSKS